ncbi:hypothetical protein ElyMa_002425600 [Elysia marginata]|uniref:Cleavage/polyadenylation specificity factor A subunit N-terminal domain-containing protein n=1 Tax=Elysia marginata TaxID=1093978 RepID=A0AAV4GIA5_9GAST|nr:hypothetical protein ElyMa_002425600 [Elysia marginata]
MLADWPAIADEDFESPYLEQSINLEKSETIKSSIIGQFEMLPQEVGEWSWADTDGNIERCVSLYVFDVGMDRSEPVEISKQGQGKVMSFHLGSVYNVRQIVFNNDQVVVLCSDELAVVAIDLASHTLKDVKLIPLGIERIHKMILIQNLLLLLKSEGSLNSAQICYDVRNGVTLTNFRLVRYWKEEPQLGLPPEVRDIRLHNNILYVLTIIGDLYLSALDSCDHDTLERNFLPPFNMEKQKQSITSQLAVTSQGGLKVAVLEQFHDGQNWLSQVHMVYIRRKRN